MSETDSKLNTIEKEIKDKEATLLNLKTEIKSRQKLLDELNQIEKPNQDSLVKTLQRQEDEILLRDKQINVLNQKIDDFKSNKAYIEKEAKIQELEKQINFYKQQIDTKDEELGKQQLDLEEKQQKIEQLEKNDEKMNEEISHLNSILSEARLKQTEISSEKDKILEDYRILEEKLANFSNQKESDSESIQPKPATDQDPNQELINTVLSLKNQVEELKLIKEEYEQRHSNLEKKIADISQDPIHDKSFQDEIKKLKSEIAISDDRIETLTEKLNRLKKKKKEKDIELMQMENRYNGVAEKYYQLERALENDKSISDREKDDLRLKLDTSEPEAKKQKDFTYESNEELRKLLEVKDKKIEQSSLEISELKDKIKSLNNQLENIQQLNNAQNLQNGSKEELDVYKKLLNDAHQIINEQKQKIYNFEQESTTKEEQEKQIKNIREEYELQLSQMRRALQVSESQNGDKMTLLVQQEKKLVELEEQDYQQIMRVLSQEQKASAYFYKRKRRGGKIVFKNLDFSNQKLEDMSRTLKDGLVGIQEKILYTNNQLIEARTSLKARESELNQAKIEKTNAQRKLREITDASKVLRESIASKDQEIAKKDQAGIKMMEEINLLRNRIRNANSRLNRVLEEQVKEYERRIKEKDTEIEVIKEMLKSSKSMIRFRDGEIEKLKRLLSGESPKIELPNVHDRLYKSSKSNKSIQNKYHAKINHPQANNIFASKHSQSDHKLFDSKADVIYNGKDEAASFFSNQTDEKRAFLPQITDPEKQNFSAFNVTSPAAATDQTKKKKQNTNNIFDPNFDGESQPQGQPRISPVIVKKKNNQGDQTIDHHDHVRDQSTHAPADGNTQHYQSDLGDQSNQNKTDPSQQKSKSKQIESENKLENQNDEELENDGEEIKSKKNEEKDENEEKEEEEEEEEGEGEEEEEGEKSEKEGDDEEEEEEKEGEEDEGEGEDENEKDEGEESEEKDEGEDENEGEEDEDDGADEENDKGDEDEED